MAEAIAGDYLAIVATDPRLAALEIDARLTTGLREEELPRVAAERPGSLLIMSGDQGDGFARTLLGSDVDSIVHSFTTLLVVVPPRAMAPAPLERLAMGIDPSPLAAAVDATGRWLAAALGATPVAVEVLQPETLPPDRFVATFPTISAHHVIVRGHPGPMLLTVARAWTRRSSWPGCAALAREPAHVGSTADWLGAPRRPAGRPRPRPVGRTRRAVGGRTGDTGRPGATPTGRSSSPAPADRPPPPSPRPRATPPRCTPPIASWRTTP
ncbi:MAG: hypothetical protein U0531_11175 [Dehalococcoidia bacterium]